jgi:opacity protein-like surface antigen
MRCPRLKGWVITAALGLNLDAGRGVTLLGIIGIEARGLKSSINFS